jgi:hypothetical protein
LRITPATHMFPPGQNTIDCKLQGIVVDPHADLSAVVRQIVVRSDLGRKLSTNYHALSAILRRIVKYAG